VYLYKTKLMALLTLVSCNAFAEWTKIGDFKGGYVYVDTVTEVETSNIRNALFMINWLQPPSDDYVKGAYRSSLKRIYFDCPRRKMQDDGSRFFKELDLEGGEVPTIGMELPASLESIDSPRLDIESASEFDAAFNYICKVH